MFGLDKKFNSLRSRTIVWTCIVIIPILGLASLWLYLFLCFFYNHYVIIPLTHPPLPTMTLISQPFMQETLIAWVILLGIICIYAGIIGIIANRRFRKILQHLDPHEVANNTARTNNDAIAFPKDVLYVIDSIKTLNVETQYKLNQYQQINADMTHELRNPLHTIGLAIESIREGLITPTPQMFAILYNEVKRIHRLVEDMRTLSLLDINKFPLYCKPTNLHEIVMHVVITKNVLAQQHNLQIIVTDPPLTIIDIDADRIMQVIANILDNAIRHSAPGDTISLQYTVHTDTVTIRICDTGTGIAADDIPHLFTRFYRGTTPKGHGSGLGLAIAHAIITAHGGTITIESVVDHGTTVIIQLPREYTESQSSV